MPRGCAAENELLSPPAPSVPGSGRREGECPPDPPARGAPSSSVTGETCALPGRALGGCDGRTRRGQRTSLRAQRARGVGAAASLRKRGAGRAPLGGSGGRGRPLGPESVAAVRRQLGRCGFRWRPSISPFQQGLELGRIAAESSPTSRWVSHGSRVLSPLPLGELNPGGVKPCGCASRPAPDRGAPGSPPQAPAEAGLASVIWETVPSVRFSE